MDINLYFFNTATIDQAYRQIEPLITGLSKFNTNIFYNTTWDIEHNKALNIISRQLSIKDYIKQYKETKTLFFCFSAFDVNKLKFMIKKNKNYKIMFRPRGILPEESYYRYRSMLRKKVLDIIEYNAIKDSDCFCYIARTQQTHFLSKYYYNKKIMNSIIVHNYLSYGEILKDKNRTGRIRIVYSGGFSKWQKVEDIFKLVSRIIKENINIDFYIYTFKSNFSIAEQYIKKYNLDGYAFIENHEPEKLIHELSKNDIGILLRDSNIINLTASPFKVMDYLNARLGVILTENVGDYSLSLNGKEYAYMLNLIGSEVPGYELDRVVNFIKSYIEKKQKMLEVIEHDLVNQFNLDNEIYLLNNFILNIFE